MKAMVLKRLASFEENRSPLELEELPVPRRGDGELIIRVAVCGVCHTELDEIEGRTPPPRLPVIPGHQVVGRVVEAGGEGSFRPGDRVGVAWIHSACGICPRCLEGRENLCSSFRATGRDADGGYAEYMTVPAEFAHRIPDAFTDAEAAPLLCAGAIGFRSLRLSGLRNGGRLGLTGFGASAHLVLQLVRKTLPDAEVFVFARSPVEQDFARELGAVWAGGTGDTPPAPLSAIIDTTPAWKPVVAALPQLEPGGRLVINAIRKEDRDKGELLGIDYPSHLWQEKEIVSVANVTREDVGGFLRVAAEIPIRPELREFPLASANEALAELKRGGIRGAKVLRVTAGE